MIPPILDLSFDADFAYVSTALAKGADQYWPIVLIAHCEITEFRRVHLLARKGATELLIEDVDDLALLPALLNGEDLSTTLTDLGLIGFERLPRNVRAGWQQAALSPREWSVKRVAYEAGISTRELQRTMKEFDMPPPRDVLFSLQRGDDIRRSRTSKP